MKKLLLIAVCCLILCGCSNKDTTRYSTFCSSSSNELINQGSILRTTIYHDKTSYTSYLEDNSYLFNTIDEAINVEKELIDDCNNTKNEYVDCIVKRNEDWIYVTTSVKCNNDLDCSYEKLVNNYKEKNMECIQDTLK